MVASKDGRGAAGIVRISAPYLPLLSRLSALSGNGDA
jgi:hypothetical protein